MSGMANQRKCKRSRKLPEFENKDIISSLPDEVLGRILSLLPTKYAVASSVLSSRWRNLYKLSDNLDFDDSLSFHPQIDLGNRYTSKLSTRFVKFVYGVLARCESSQISKFRLKCRKYVEYPAVIDWVKAAFFRKVTELELSFQMHIPLVLQLDHSTCKNLVVLKLDCNFKLRVPKFVRFPSLKVLYCKGIIFDGDSSILFPSNGEIRLNGLNGILFGCQSLEELSIVGCQWNGGDLYFGNPLLRKLTLDVDMSGPLDQLSGCLIYFHLPNLVYLNYSDSLPEQYVIKDLSSVVNAHFKVGFNDDDYDEPQQLCDTILDLITGVRYCEVLYLSRQCLEALTSGEFELPMFQNLTRLELCQGVDVSWNDTLLDFLSNSPCLETLTLEQDIRFDDHFTGIASNWKIGGQTMDEDFFLSEHPVPSCVASRLKSINIKDFNGFKSEMEMVKYFLESANVLVEMTIHWHERTKIWQWFSREKDILKFQKASKTCSIAFN